MRPIHLLWVAGPLAMAAAAANAQLLGGTWHDDCQCYRNMRWGSEVWYEPEVRKLLRQDLDYFPVLPDPAGAAPAPLIIYAHAATATKFISVDRGRLYPVVVQQARANGFAVASIEYRHPIKDDYIVPAPHDDIAEATRWLRAQAAELGIDRRNVFHLGHSRGSLAVWTALHYWDDPTARVNAVYAYNAQTSYRGSEMAERFLVPEDRAGFVADFESAHPQHPLFGSALADASGQMPAVLLRYEKPFHRRLVQAAEFDGHHPDFGLALCEGLLPRSPRASCTAVDDTPVEHAYDGFVEFFLQHLEQP